MNANDGGPAYPCQEFNQNGEAMSEMCSGVSVRDYFAAQIMGGFVSSPGFTVDIEGERIGIARARMAYVIADAMIAARANVETKA